MDTFVNGQDRKTYYKRIFDQCDVDNDGLIRLKQLKALGESNIHLLEKKRIDNVIHVLGDKEDITLSFTQFFKLMIFPDNEENKSSSPVLRYIGTLISRTSTNLRTPANRAEEPSRPILLCILMVVLSLFQLALFVSDKVGQTNWNGSGNGSISMLLIFEHSKRYQLWRFLTYILVHVSYIDLLVNLSLQLFLGIYLGKVHGSFKTSILYFVGVLSGSMLSSSTDIWTRLAGVSGGVYALFTAHLINIFMQMRVLSTKTVVLMTIITFLVGCNLGSSIYERYCSSADVKYSYVSLIGGIVTGATLGVLLFKKGKSTNIILWMCIIFHVLLPITAVLVNVWPPQPDTSSSNYTLFSEIAEA